MQTTRFRYLAALRPIPHLAGFVAASFVGLVALVAASHAPAAAAAVPQSGQFDEISTIVAPRLTVKITKTVTFKGANYRIDMIPYSRILAGGTLYSYLPDEQTAMRATAPTKEPSLPDQLLAQKEQVVQGATKTGSDTVGGFECDIYAPHMQAGDDSTVHVWVSRDPRFPFIVKTVSVNQKQGVTDTEEITEDRLNTPISDTIFALPKDTKVVDAPQQDNSSPDNGNTGGAAPPATNPAPAPTGNSTATPPPGTSP